MLEYLHLPPVAQGVLAISAVALAVVRLLTASRPFWAWEKVPVWIQKALPALLMAVAALPTAIEHARSWLDVLVGFVVTGSMWFTASRGDKRPPQDKGGGPRLERTNTDPKLTSDELFEDEPTPPSLPGVGLIGLALLALVGCHNAKPPCDEAKLKAVDKVFLADVAKTCLTKYDSEKECPEYPGLKAKHSRDLKGVCP